MSVSCGFRGCAAFLLLGAAPLVLADSMAIIGTSSPLADGSQALFAGDFDSGIRLTIEGLKYEVAPARRAAALSNLCAGYVGAQRYDEAVATCTDALELRSSNWRAYNNRAIAELGRGNYAAARRDVAAGLALHPESRQLTRVRDMIQARDPVLLAANDLGYDD